EIDNPGDVSVSVEGQPFDRILDIVPKEITTVIVRRELTAAIDKASGDGGITPAVRVRKDRGGCSGDAAIPLLQGPAIVRASDPEVHFLDGGAGVVTPDVADIHTARDRIDRHAERIPQAVRPDRILVGTRAVVERIVSRNGPVAVDAQDLATVAVQPL